MQLRTQLVLFASTAVILSGCSRVMPGKGSTASTPVSMREANQIAEAMQQGKPLACVITNTNDQSTMAYAIEGEKMKVTGMQAEGQTQAGSMLNDGQMLYIWDETTLQGTKMALPDPTEVAEAQEQAEQYLQGVPDFSDEVIQESYEDQGYTIDCQPGNFPADFFTPPTNVTFQDLSQMMESFSAMSGEAMTEEQQQALDDIMMQLEQ